MPAVVQNFKLSLTQAGATISGNLDVNASDRFRVPVVGLFAPSTLNFSGVTTRPQDAGTYQLRVSAWTSRSDGFGRMDGTFVLEEESVGPDYRYAARYNSELQDVYLLPDWLQLGAASARSFGGSTRSSNVPAPLLVPERLLLGWVIGTRLKSAP